MGHTRVQTAAFPWHAAAVLILVGLQRQAMCQRRPWHNAPSLSEEALMIQSRPALLIPTMCQRRLWHSALTTTLGIHDLCLAQISTSAVVEVDVACMLERTAISLWLFAWPVRSPVPSGPVRSLGPSGPAVLPYLLALAMKEEDVQPQQHAAVLIIAMRQELRMLERSPTLA